ncbi:MAG: hypothetical protein WCV00_01885 [Verrucomicrobiia bacterium]
MKQQQLILAAFLLASLVALHAADSDSLACGNALPKVPSVPAPSIAVAKPAASPPAQPATAASPQRPLIGVIRWDMYSGHPFTTHKQEFGFLKPEQYHWRAPFFARRTGNPDAPLTFNPGYSMQVYQEAMEQEIQFAASSSIDYWAFGYEGPSGRVRHPLRDALDAYLASPRKSRVNFCLIVNCPVVAKVGYYEPPSVRHTEKEIDDDWRKHIEDIVALMKQPTYQRVLGDRPLIYLYMTEFLGEGRRRTPAPAPRVERSLRLLREQLVAAGVRNPYLVGMIDTRVAGWEALFDGKLLDCVTLYHQRYAGSHLQYGTLWGFIQSNTLYGTFKRPDLKVIPTTMSGANGMPRYKKGGAFPVWDWSEPAPGELSAHVTGAFDYVAQNPAKCEANTIIMYAWNEHSEGGFLCPTMGKAPDYRPVTRQIDEISQALKNWTSPQRRKQIGFPVANFSFGDRAPSLQSSGVAGDIRASDLEIPPYAYFIAENSSLSGRQGNAVRYHARVAETEADAFRFTVQAPDGCLLHPERLEFSLRVSKGAKLDATVWDNWNAKDARELIPIEISITESSAQGSPGSATSRTIQMQAVPGVWLPAGVNLSDVSLDAREARIQIHLRTGAGNQADIDDLRLFIRSATKSPVKNPASERRGSPRKIGQP